MNEIFNNIPSYQVILIVMGIIIFAALVFLLIWSVLKKRSIAVLLPFFLIPVIMVAFPALRSVKIGSVVINIKKLTGIVNNNPGDTVAGKQLIEALSQLKKHSNLTQNSSALLAVANAQMALGRYDSVAFYLHQADKAVSGSQEIILVKKELNKRIFLQQNFSREVQQLKQEFESMLQSPGDTQILRRMVNDLSNMQAPGYITPEEALTLAKAYAITGDTQQSLTILNRLDLPGSPLYPRVMQLKNQIQNNTFQKQFFKLGIPAPVLLSNPVQKRDFLEKTAIQDS